MERASRSETAAARYLLLALHGDGHEPSEDEMVGGVLLARGLRNLESLTRTAASPAGVKLKE